MYCVDDLVIWTLFGGSEVSMTKKTITVLLFEIWNTVSQRSNPFIIAALA
jgi:hypothetical protein